MLMDALYQVMLSDKRADINFYLEVYVKHVDQIGIGFGFQN